MQIESLERTPKLSVITVVRNGEKTIEKCIQSVINQINNKIEYLIIDGQSTDNTIEIIKKYESEITYRISQKDKNIADAFNKGIAKARGEYVIFLNADDWFNEGVLTNFLELKTSDDVVHGNIKYWADGVEKLVRIGNHQGLENEMTLNHPATFMKLELIKNLGGFNIERKIAIDYELILKAKKSGASFRHISNVITNMSLSGVSDVNWFNSCKETYEVKQDVLGKSFNNLLWFVKQSSSLFLIKTLEKVGLETLISKWRNSSNKWER